MEFDVPAWNPGLTKGQVSQLELVQKCAFSIILDKDYISYKNAMIILQMKSLSALNLLSRLRRVKNTLCGSVKMTQMVLRLEVLNPP